MIEQITLAAGVQSTLTSLLANRLTCLLGAGLSMAPPTCLRSAAGIATQAKQKYDAMYGASRAPLSPNIEEQAEFFFQRGELATVYFRTLIDKNEFAGRPNLGHFAIADLLLIRAIDVAVTTNVDTLIETAGMHLYGEVQAGIDEASVVALPADSSALLKIHGCRHRTPDDMVWAPGQLTAPPVDDRVKSSAHWLSVKLLDRDLLIVGYWTDWDYLNAVLAATLDTVAPSRVTIVDLADQSTFACKAPALFDLGKRAKISFQHVKASGSEFLDDLRKEFCKSYLRQILHNGSPEYLAITGANPDAAWIEPPDLDNDSYWAIRRDLEGRPPNKPAQERSPPAEPLLGLTILQIRAKGAVPDGSNWLLGDKRIRLLRAAGALLYRVEAQHERETAPSISPDLVIAIGAESRPLPPNIARGNTASTITRGPVVRWMTYSEAVQELGL